MDNETRDSRKLMGAAALAFCGVAMLVAGIATAGVPIRRSFCLSVVPSQCCSATGSLMAELPPAIAVPTLHAFTILTD